MTAEAEIQAIYEETADLYARSLSVLGDQALGYEVMYGPPLEMPPFLFVGFNPGGKTSSPNPTTWPSSTEYAEADYKLARQLRLAFDSDILEHSTGMNAIFLRTTNQSELTKIDPSVRTTFTDLGRRSVETAVRVFKPGLVVALGFSTMKLFTNLESQPLQRRGRWLAYEAVIGGTRAVAMLHPTARYRPPSAEDMRDIGEFIRGLA